MPESELYFFRPWSSRVTHKTHFSVSTEEILACDQAGISTDNISPRVELRGRARRFKDETFQDVASRLIGDYGLRKVNMTEISGFHPLQKIMDLIAGAVERFEFTGNTTTRSLACAQNQCEDNGRIPITFAQDKNIRVR